MGKTSEGGLIILRIISLIEFTKLNGTGRRALECEYWNEKQAVEWDWDWGWDWDWKWISKNDKKGSGKMGGVDIEKGWRDYWISSEKCPDQTTFTIKAFHTRSRHNEEERLSKNSTCIHAGCDITHTYNNTNDITKT